MVEYESSIHNCFGKVHTACSVAALPLTAVASAEGAYAELGN